MTSRVALLVAGGVLVAAAVFPALTRWGAVTASHPAYLLLLGACALVGVTLVAVGLRRPRGGSRGPWRTAARIAGVALAVVVGGFVIWLRPFDATEPALRALTSGDGVVVTESATRIRMRPAAARQRDAALVFLPGARVDPRAYAALLRPLAEAGHPVVIVKPALGVGLLARGAATDEVRRAAADDRPVAVGGHSLGGTAAAMVVEEERAADGLLLWASFPANDALAERTDLVVTSISGGRDGLATPADIADSRADLPPDTRSVVIPGAVHADFGDYGAQRGDGERAISRERAQQAIVAASLRFLREVTAEGPD